MSPQPKTPAAARKEAAAGPKSITWKGIEFTLPDSLPGDLIWALADMENGDRSIRGIVDTLEQLIGPVQVLAVRQKLRDENADLETAVEQIGELIGLAMSEYGTSPGESPASDAS